MNAAAHTPHRGTNTASRAHVVYDGKTGEVLHIHHTVSHDEASSHEEPHARALRHAGKRAGANAEVIEVESREVSHGRPIRVDLATKAIAPKT